MASGGGLLVYEYGITGRSGSDPGEMAGEAQPGEDQDDDEEDEHETGAAQGVGHGILAGEGRSSRAGFMRRQRRRGASAALDARWLGIIPCSSKSSWRNAAVRLVTTAMTGKPFTSKARR